MSEPPTDDQDTAIIPFWVFFASGSKWLGGFVAGCVGLFCTELLTTDLLWISIVTGTTAFAGWSMGTYLDINSYLAQRWPKS